MLPKWNLADLYKSIQDEQIEKDIDIIAKDIDRFVKDYRFNQQDLYQAIQSYESIQEKIGKILSYAYLEFATKANEPDVLSFFQNIQDRLNLLSSSLIFFTLSINKLEDDYLQQAYQVSFSLNRYRPWIESIRLFKDHQLSEELEKILHEKSLSSRYGWIRLFEETLASMVIEKEGKTYTLSAILNDFSSKNPHTRKNAAELLSKGLSDKISTLTLITNILAKDKEIEDTWRHYKNPMSERHLANQVEEEVVETLISTVKKNYSTLSHRYYALKAKWLGVEKIQYWDRNAPLPDSEDVSMSWEEAKKTVLQAYGDFSITMKEIAARFFDCGWIDAQPKLGKDSGAFSHPTVPSLHPYILMNFHGKLRDVMTLAHELGHGVHQVLAAPQGILLADTPLTIAETASVFGEMLTFKALLKQQPKQKKALLASKVEDMINTVVRQVAFYEFEKEVHVKRRKKELTAQELGTIWIQTQQEALGEDVYLSDLIQPYWGYISHFIRSPFYVYAYAFGDCLVNSLYSVYESGDASFQEKYLDLLKAGGTKKYYELLSPFGLNAKDPSFWQKGLDVINKMIDELEK
ncbi:MAG: M3 family oligoendopeptidase [Proteobacteria bacterium]|nr:M3 family oligoendopeptidase [Pseudomonadota bacterium]